MEEAGVNLAEMNKLLLMKVEELTLYSIQLEKEVEAVRSSESEVRREMEKMTEDRRRETDEMKERLSKLEALLLK
jgi:FtsZ-binding cell division protein ZapB